MSLHFQLISATDVKYDDEAYEVLVPTKDGMVAVFEDHMPLLSAGAAGVLSVRKKASDSPNTMEHFAVYGGILQVDGKSARFVTDDVTTTEEVSEQEAQEALARAQEMVAGAGTRQALHEAKMVMHHQEARLHLARLKRRHHQ
ncbi:MAG TPA: ATP synthase F1 subunit epsilon [Candidatus Saccharimonadales bacterium]|nr:ATP synthase F1 subunit epsilon [Candidatus Saccharimonadales bacterium]